MAMAMSTGVLMPGTRSTQSNTESSTGQSGPAGKMRILVVDDHRTLADLLALAFGQEPDMECVGHARTTGEALRMVEELRPDVVVMDVRLADGDGIATTATLTARYAELRVVILTGHADATLVRRAAAAGACGFLPKDGALDGMLHAMRSARRGSLVMHPEVIAQLALDTSHPAAHAGGPELAPRELEVLDLLARGLAPKAIARRTGLAPEDCRGHLESVMAKLDARSLLEAVVTANRYGLIAVGPS